MLFRRHPQHLHGELFERKQHFRLVGEQKLDIRSRKFHHHFRILEVGMPRLPAADLKLQREAGVRDHLIQKLADARIYARERVLLFVHPLPPFLRFGATTASTGCGAGTGMLLLINHCCAIPTTLLVNQYNTRPLDML